MVSIGLYFPPPFFCCCISLPLLISLCFPLGSVFRFGWISCRYLEISEASLMVSFCQYWASFSFPPFFCCYYCISSFSSSLLIISLLPFRYGSSLRLNGYLVDLEASRPPPFFCHFANGEFLPVLAFIFPSPPPFFCFVVSLSFLFTNVFASL